MVFASSWGVLGYYRGTQHYDYKCKIEMEKYNEKMVEYNKAIEKYNIEKIRYSYAYEKTLPSNKPAKYYITNILFGLYGSCLYIYPLSGLLYFFKEIYRLEVYLRNLPDEKKKRYYNTLDI
jgi:hypothetical protein